MRYHLVKMLLDRLMAFVLLLLFCWLLAVIWLVLFLSIKRPFFRQARTGKGGKVFTIYKFRTLKSGVLDETTFIGKFLRKTSLDELPQLINILKGEMSFVGPRPLLPEYLPRYNKRQQKRHDVKPGITGWAQVKGRNSLSWVEQFELDIWYVENQGFWLDLKIVLLTIGKILKPTSGELVLRRPFRGNENNSAN